MAPVTPAQASAQGVKKRGRGRPRKTPLLHNMATIDQGITKRGRGRPRKAKTCGSRHNGSTPDEIKHASNPNADSDNNIENYLTYARKSLHSTYENRVHEADEQLKLEITEMKTLIKSAQSDASEALKEMELFKKEVAAGKRIRQEKEFEITGMKESEQKAENERSEAQGVLRAATAEPFTLQTEHKKSIATSNTEKSELQQGLEKANAAISAFKAELFNIKEELNAVKVTASMLLTEHGEFVAATSTERTTVKDEIKNLQSLLSNNAKAYDDMKVERDRYQKRTEEVDNEIGEIRRLINVLESKQLEDAEAIRREMLELAELFYACYS
ncbi:hypothetical protein F4678DRAFT_467248 [Xylaria arbuscula]|nr:hypothetical protein F4678DRAFT_467248 [Xylaria arbuscula]